METLIMSDIMNLKNYLIFDVALILSGWTNGIYKLLGYMVWARDLVWAIIYHCLF